MKRFAWLLIMPVWILAITLGGCKEKIKPNDPTEKLVKVGAESNNGYMVEVFADDSLFVGFNRLYIRITDENADEVKSDFSVQLQPMMDMGTMQHAAPVENPNGQANADGLYEGAVVFIMPSTAGTWMLTVNAGDAQGNSTSVTLNPVIKMPAEARLLSFLADNSGDNLFVSLVSPLKPVIGLNEFEIAIHKKESMMNFPPVDGLTVTIEPEMPSMGHGSPNNENPASIGNGHYKGKVNFTMTGYWKVNMDIFNGQDTVKTGLAFDITF